VLRDHAEEEPSPARRRGKSVRAIWTTVRIAKIVAITLETVASQPQAAAMSRASRNWRMFLNRSRIPMLRIRTTPPAFASANWTD
jgi:hypothetical protein